jgi:hypothetical protein
MSVVSWSGPIEGVRETDIKLQPEEKNRERQKTRIEIVFFMFLISTIVVAFTGFSK